MHCEAKLLTLCRMRNREGTALLQGHDPNMLKPPEAPPVKNFYYIEKMGPSLYPTGVWETLQIQVGAGLFKCRQLVSTRQEWDSD